MDSDTKKFLGDPTFHRWKDAISFPEDQHPTRQRGKSGFFLLGGTHLSYYTYAPYFMLRMLSFTECGAWTTESVHKFFTEHIIPFNESHSLEVFETFVQRRKKNQRIKLLSNIKQDLSKIIVPPWFYICNKDRYPAWEGKHDSRVI